jgi:hypothetical protein
MFLLFIPHSLLPVQRVDSLASSWWFGGLVLIILMVLALSVSAHRKQYTLYVRNLLNKQGRVMNYDQESTSVWADVLLWFVVVSSYALLLMTYSAQLNFFLLFVIVSAYLGLKWALIRFVGYVFGLKDVVRAFSTDYFVIVALLGLFLLPIIFGMIYMPAISDFVWYGVLLIMGLLVFITLFIKLLQIFYTRFSSLFYIFLYLCTSEILPLLVAAKVASIVVNMV